MDGITILVAAMIVLGCAFCISLLNQLVIHPWLILVVIAAIVIYVMGKRSRDNMR